MAYITGDSILEAHFNGFVDGTEESLHSPALPLNDIWGVGYGDHGYGQSNTITPVAIGGTVQATEWAALIGRMGNAASHQGSTLTSQNLPTTGDTIEILDNLVTDLTTLTANRMNNDGNTSDTADPGSSSGSASGTWTDESKHTFTVTFDGGDEARYFFNCGGQIDITLNRTGGTAHNKNTEWTDLTATLIDTITFSANDCSENGSGTPATSGVGYYQLVSSTNTSCFKMVADTAPYTANYVEVKCNPGAAHADGNGNVGNVLTFEVIFKDDAADTDSADDVDGTLTSDITFRTPTTTHLNNASWGTVTGAEVSFTQS